MVHPVGSRASGTETFLNNPVGPLDHAIRLGVIGGGTEGRNPQKLMKLRPQRGGELASLI